MPSTCDAEAAPRPPWFVALGAAALALGAGANLALLLPFRLPAGIDVVGYSTYYAYPAQSQVRSYLVLGALVPLFSLGLLALWGRVPGRWRVGAGAGFASCLALLGALPPAVGVTDAIPDACAGALVAALGIALAARLVRTDGGEACLWLAGSGGALGLWLSPRPWVVLLGAAGSVALGAACRRLVSPRKLLALSLPAWALPLEVMGRARLLDGERVVGGYTIGALAWLPLGVLAASGAIAVYLLGWRTEPDTRRLRALCLWLAVPVLAYGLAFHYRVHGSDLDGLHEGEPLAAAAALEAGKLPYRDLVFFHGLGEDPGRALIAFRLFGRSVRGLRVLRDLLGPADLAALVLVGVAALPARWAIVYATAAVAGLLPTGHASRSLFSDLALVGLLWTLRRPGPWRGAMGGAAAAGAALWGLDTGLAVLLAGGAALGLRALVDPPGRRAALGFALGSGAVLGTFALVLAASGLLGAFLATARDVASSFGLAFARPYEFAFDTRSGFLTTVGAPAVLAAGAVGLALAALGPRRGTGSWLLLLLWLDAFLQFERAVDRHDPAHALQGARIAWPLLFLLVSRLQTRLERPLWAVLAALLVLPGTRLPGVRELIRDHGRKQDVPIAGRMLVANPRLGVLVSAEQGSRLGRLLAVLERIPAGKTFFDFTNHGALYFLSGRPLPTRYPLIWLAASPAAQREVVAALEADPPPMVVFRSASSYDALDHIDNRIRHYLVAEHLVRDYRPFARVSGFDLLAPRSAGREAPLATSDLDLLPLRAVPSRWGAGAVPGRPRLTPPLGLEPQEPGGIRIGTTELERGDTHGLLLVIHSEEEGTATLRWEVLLGDGLAEAGVSFDVFPDAGGGRSYLVALSVVPAWVWPERVGVPFLTLSSPAARLERAHGVRDPLSALAPGASRASPHPAHGLRGDPEGRSGATRALAPSRDAR